MTLVEDLILTNFPKSIDCIAGHHGEATVVYGLEQDDDRYHCVRYSVCGHCGVPITGVDYVGFEEEEELHLKGIL